MQPQPSVAAAAFLIADPARAAMLTALIDGRARPAGELAYAAGVTAQTASSHLAKLLDGGLLSVETEGRHRYYRLAGPEVAGALESLAAIGPGEVRRRPLSPLARKLRLARCCYDHLAGQVGVAVTQGLERRGYLVAAPDKRFEVTPAGLDWFAGHGLAVERLKATRKGLARQCLDWTEREHHLAGPLGVAFLGHGCARGWFRRSTSSRAVEITPAGWAVLRQELGVDSWSLPSAA